MSIYFFLAVGRRAERTERDAGQEGDDALRELPFLGVDAKGKVAGNIDVRFTIQPDLSGKDDFVVRATW